MSPRNRKMFRPRNAGKQAAGILASSPQLMQTVQKRNIGGLIRNQILPDIAIDQTFTPRPFVGNPIGSPSFRTRPLEARKSGRSFTPIPGAGNMMRRMGPPVSQGPTGPSFRTRPPEARRPVPGGGLGSFITGSGEVNPLAIASTSPSFRTRPPGAPRPEDSQDAFDLAALNPRLNVDGPTVAEQMTDSAVSGADTQSQVGSISRPKDIPEKKEALKPAADPTLSRPEIDDSSKAKLETLLTQAQNNAVQGDIKLTDDEAADPKAAEALSEVLPEEVSLSEMEKEAQRIMGFDPSKAKQDKKDAFYRNLMMAGLAIAAGESSNALTNVAKGLAVGLDSYSKDIALLDQRDAEERKEYRSTLRSLIKNKQDENIALAGLESDFKYRLASLQQNQDQFESTQEFKQKELDLRKSLAAQQLQVSLTSTLASLEIQEDKLALQGETLDETKKQNEITNNLNSLIKKPDFVQNAIELGYATIDKDGKTQWTPEGQAWVDENRALILKEVLIDRDDTGPKGMTEERYIQEQMTSDAKKAMSEQIIEEKVNSGELTQEDADAGRYIPTDEQIIEKFRNQYYLIQDGQSKTEPEVGSVVEQAKPEVGSVVEQDGKKYRITGYNGNKPTVKLVE